MIFKNLLFGIAGVFLFAIFGCTLPSESFQKEFNENNALWCQEQASRVTERDDPAWQGIFDNCMETGQLK